MLNRILILLCSLGIYPAFASANYHLMLEKMAEDVVAAQIQSPEHGKVEIKSSSLDARLDLTPCDESLDLTIVNGQIKKKHRR